MFEPDSQTCETPTTRGVVDAPVLIDTLNGQMHQDGTVLQGNSTVGGGASVQLFNASGALYALLSENVVTSHARMFRSTDNGTTWVAQDIAHEPGSSGLNLNSDVNVFQRGATIYALWVVSPVALQQHFVWNSFNTVTNLWGTESAQGPLNITGAIGVEFCVLSTGDLYVYKGNATGVAYLLYSGGAWAGAVVVVDAGVANDVGDVKMVTVDSLDRMHVVYQLRGSVTTLADLLYVQVSAAGVVGAPATLLTGAIALDIYTVGQGPIWLGTTLVVPYQRTSDNITTVLLGTPLAAPVWTPAVVDPAASTVPAGDRANFPCAALDGNGDLNVFWATNSAANADDRVWTAVNTGAGFSTPITFYTNGTNPPPGEDPASPGLVNASSPTLLDTNVFGYLWDSVITTPGIGGTATFFLLGSGGSSTCVLGVSGSATDTQTKTFLLHSDSIFVWTGLEFPPWAFVGVRIRYGQVYLSSDYLYAGAPSGGSIPGDQVAPFPIFSPQALPPACQMTIDYINKDTVNPQANYPLVFRGFKRIPVSGGEA